MQLNLNNISFSYPESSVSVFDGLTVFFPCGWTGLVGPNGCGKTTLAMVAAGLLVPDSGRVFPSLVSSYCRQDPSRAPFCLWDFAADWGTDAVRIRAMLQIDESWLWDYDSLSGGQKKRVQIACALWARPDVLVMDEPTNDLDADSRDTVFAALRSFKGVGILISHDRSLLDDLASRCLVFEGGRFLERAGGYTQAMRQGALERDSRQRAHKAARTEERRICAEARRRSEAAARSKSRLSGRGLSGKDGDARRRLRLARVTGKDTVAGRASAVMSGRLGRAQAASDATRVEKRYDPRFSLPGEASRAGFLLHLSEGSVRAGGLSVAYPEIWVLPKDRIAITGRNGAGKTTLVKHLVASVPDRVSVACIPQEVDASCRREALESFRSLDNDRAGNVLSFMAKLGSDPHSFIDGGDISPGELRKLLIALRLMSGVNLLVLDEPANHLDAPSVEALQSALCAFPGALLMVSHDRMLVDRVCDKRWEIVRNGDESRLRIHP